MIVFAYLTTLMHMTRTVILAMTEEESQYHRTECCPIGLRYAIEVDNEFEAWKLVHRLQTKRRRAVVQGERTVHTDYRMVKSLYNKTRIYQ